MNYSESCCQKKNSHNDYKEIKREEKHKKKIDVRTILKDLREIFGEYFQRKWKVSKI